MVGGCCARGSLDRLRRSPLYRASRPRATCICASAVGFEPLRRYLQWNLNHLVDFSCNLTSTSVSLSPCNTNGLQRGRRAIPERRLRGPRLRGLASAPDPAGVRRARQWAPRWGPPSAQAGPRRGLAIAGPRERASGGPGGDSASAQAGPRWGLAIAGPRERASGQSAGAQRARKRGPTGAPRTCKRGPRRGLAPQAGPHWGSANMLAWRTTVCGRKKRV